MNKCLTCQHYEDRYPTCDECKYESIKDKPIKVKQLVFTFSYKYVQKFELTENNIELYSDEFKFYQSDEDIEIDSGIGIFQLTSEIFVPIDTSIEYINKIKIQVKEAMKNWFEKRIKELTHGLEVLKDEI